MTNLISFVIPVFRNAGSLNTTYARIKTLAEEMNYQYEIIFVNDGSDDSSLSELISIHDNDPSAKIISFSRNFGQVAAIIAGFKQVSGSCCILMSADLQDPIEKAREMILKWEQGSDIVICYRIEREDSIVARMTSYLFYRMIKTAIPKMPEGGFDFILMNRKAVSEFNKIEERNRFFQGDILWLGYNLSFIPYARQKRTIGKSQWSISKKIKYFIDGLLNTSYIPIRLMSALGLLTAISGFFYAMIIAYAKLVKQTPFPGWAPIMILILIIGGIVMLMLGIIGEYLWRTYDESRKRPLYIIDRKLGFPE